MLRKDIYYYFCVSDAVEPAMSSQPLGTEKVAFKDRWLLIGGSFVYEMPFWEMMSDLP